MQEVQLRRAKATLSALIDEAKRGEPSIITRHGKPEAVVIGYEEWQRLAHLPSFGRLLMSAPLDPDTEVARDQSGLRPLDG
jgi:prevent-host-death family protein